jgi:hypothetical protein
MKTLHQNNSALGGYGYRALLDKDRVKLQERHNGGRWKTIRTVGLSEFDAFAESVNLYDAYNDDPAHLANFTNQLY